MKVRLPSPNPNLKYAVCITPLLLASFVFGNKLMAHQQVGGLLSGGPRQSVVVENGVPAVKFVSRDGSVAFVYFKKHGDEDSFAVNVIDWDNFKTKSGWIYFTAKRIIFESDENEKRGFDVSKDDVKLKIENKGLRFFIVKVSGKEKKFMVTFSPPLTPWGKHQDTVFELIRRLMTDYDLVLSELRQETAKLIPKPDQRESAPNSPSSSSQLKSEEAKVLIDVASEPSGAEIYVDGVFAGSTPSKLSVKVGEHSIRVTRPGFKDWERRILVDSESSKVLNAILDKKEP
jgi:hypothetical protein